MAITFNAQALRLCVNFARSGVQCPGDSTENRTDVLVFFVVQRLDNGCSIVYSQFVSEENMYLTKSAKTEIRQIKSLWIIESQTNGTVQTVFAPNEISVLDKVFPPGSAVKEATVPNEAPEGARAYLVAVHKTIALDDCRQFHVVVYPVLAIV